MNTIDQILRSPVMDTLGWTLFHSLWLGLVCYAATTVALRLIPTKMSELRYAVSTVGLVSIFVSSALAYFMISEPQISDELASAPLTHGIFVFASYHPVEASAAPIGILQTIFSALQKNMALIVLAWSVGVLFYTIRIIGGYWYTGRIRSGATVLGYEWQDRILELAEKLEISRSITLAESAIIQAPVVMGYLKPMILIPIGMMAGLSTAQLESIFIHELIHIRRGDYIVNILQSVLEAIFFFNPFVWALSSTMRREREHCCDDTVVKILGNPVAYVRALASLEEARLSRAGVALSLADNKNQLLKRIKRIMEKSVQQYSGRERYVPVVLLVLGIMCASWLTIQTERGKIKNNENLNLFQEIKAVLDTTKKEKASRFYKRTHKTIDENGQPQYEIVEEFEGEPSAALAPDMAMHFGIEPIAPIEPIEPINVDVDMPEVFGVPDMDFYVEMPEAPEPPVPDFNFAFEFEMDTLGPHQWKNNQDWNEFGKAFQERFKEKFEDFYEKHQEDLEKIMNDLEDKFNQQHEKLGVLEELSRNYAELAKAQDINAVQGVNEAMLAARQHELAAREQIKHYENEDMNRRLALQDMQAINQAVLANVQSQIHGINDALIVDAHEELEVMQKIALKELIKDGYLKEGDKINNVDISSDGVEINGKKIKSSDEKKYKDLFSPRHFGGRRE